MRIALSSSFSPGLGQPHAAIGAGEQRHPKLFLEPLHVPGQRRLGQVQMRRGAGDAAEFGDADEIVQAAQFHARGIIHPEAACHAEALWGGRKNRHLYDAGSAA